ncbi:class I adenylate-forming enzyme family protein [Alkalibacillus haloalkaliphilus]|uniref:Long-chain-fatty-acid--CoA ligase n=1 Tax=Alkalibacillus haloalkaliphilus TaxID=94136 RepID=A0A511W201_9BACI|nr:AMP-binding protein [Alkalibacillus haloalkaliphilus]GEN44801.1 long-chain-fatty-acid--CoA ligase [Alkalibacillus haloalkaliphilus]
MLGELDWLQSRAQLYPNDEAVVDVQAQLSLSYEELNDRATVLAEGLKHSGIQKGDRIALLSLNHISYFDTLFACLKVGAIFVPLNWRLSKDELTYVLQDSDPKLVIIHPEFEQSLAWLNKTYNTLLIDHSNYMYDLDRQVIDEVSLCETDPLAMIYTGGTTGKPKGAVLSHRSIMWNALNTIISWGLTKDDRTLTAIPMFHTGGLNALSIPILMAGGQVIIHAHFDPDQAVEHLIKYRCTIVLFIPTMYQFITESLIFKENDFPHMKVFLSGGAPCPLTIYERFENKRLQFREGYGLTEAGPNNFYIEPGDARLKKGSVGQEMMFNDIDIVNDAGDSVSVNEVGELWLRGKHLFEYYWNQEEETMAQLHGEWLKTGDLARRDQDGFVYIVGRKKDMIISGGENIFPLEIEHWLASHCDIQEVAVIGVPDELWGEKVVAYISTSNLNLDGAQLEIYCEEKLSRYKIPKAFYFVDELPKTHVGKINKTALTRWFQEQQIKEENGKS